MSRRALKKQPDLARAVRAPEPQRARPATHVADHPADKIFAAGNAAINDLLSDASGGRPLEGKLLAEMQESFGADFSSVRIHDDASARGKAEAAGANALTQGSDIYLGPGAPTPDSESGKRLLAHELAHVLQQQAATQPDKNSISQPGDRFEQAADVAAGQAVQGKAANAQVAGTPAAVQRDAKTVPRSQVQTVLTEFLRRAQQAQGGQALRVTKEVSNAVEMLALAPDPNYRGPGGDPQSAIRLINVQAWMKGGFLPGKPEDFARAVVQRLPDPFDAAALEKLKRMPFQAGAPDSIVGRAADVIEKSAPGSPEKEAEDAAERKAKGEEDTSSSSGPAGQPKVEQSNVEDQAEKMAQIDRRLRGQPEPTVIGPGSIDLLRVGRIWSKRREIIKGPSTPKQAPEARSYPEVDRVIKQIAPDALTPAAARTAGGTGAFADAREVASDLAQRLDIAQQQGAESIDLRFGENYHQAADRAALIEAVNRIIQQIRDALPHHATNVKYVDVYFGKSWVSRGQAASKE